MTTALTLAGVLSAGTATALVNSHVLNSVDLDQHPDVRGRTGAGHRPPDD